MVILWIAACRTGQPPGEILHGDLDFGEVPAGRVATRGLVVAGDNDAATSEPGLSLRWIKGEEQHLLLVSCDPEALEASSGNIRVSGGEVAWSCSLGAAVEEPLVAIAATPAESLSETGLGDAELAEGDAVALRPASRTGDLLMTDPRAGRLWRMNAFYRVGSWGMWGADDEETESDWAPAPDCFEEGKASRQDGSCTGLERDAEGEIPEGWSYYHGGFVEGLPGVSDGVDVPGPDVFVVVGSDGGRGWIGVIDASLDERLADEESYSYWRLVRRVADPGLDGDLRVARVGTEVVVVGVESGKALRVSGLDGAEPTLAAVGELGGPVEAWAADDQGGLAFADGRWQRVGSSLGDLDCAAWGPLAGTAPDHAASDGSRLWASFADVVASCPLDGGEAGFVAIADAGGLSADPLGYATVFVGSTLFSFTAASAPKAGLALPATPLAIGGDPLPHDVYLAYPAGSEGCDGDLAEACTAGSHPGSIQSFYLRPGLDLAVSGGHPMNLFFGPVIETPKDESVDSDFSKGTASCDGAPEDVPPDIFDACCALERSTARVSKNLDYFLESWGDATFVLGVNPSWIRQARSCLAQSDGATRERGRGALQVLAAYAEAMEFARWTHTGLTDPDFDAASAYYIDRLVGSGGWEAPVDGQEDYELLHQGLAAMYDYDDLGEMDGEALSTYELPPLVAGAGNGFDGPVMVEEGWADPSWISAIRDGAEEPLPAFYFTSAGSIPAIGITGYRKKENFPLDMAERGSVFEMGTDPTDWYEGGDSGMLNIAGMNWAVNAVGDIAGSGAFRESTIWGNSVEEEDWTAVRRYIRRSLASAPPEATKSWFVHLFDLSNNDGDFQDASGVEEGSDINVDAIEAIEAELVDRGYARWSRLSDIVAEHQD